MADRVKPPTGRAELARNNRATSNPYQRAVHRHVNNDAEASVLGGIFLRPDVLAELHDMIVDDFYSVQHQAVFQAMRNLEATARPIDPISVEQELLRVGTLEAVGGLGFLSELTLRVPSRDNVVHYARIVKANRKAREVATALIECLGELGNYGEDLDGEDVTHMVIDRMQRIELSTAERGKTMGKIIVEQFARFYGDLQAIERGEVVRPGSTTGIAIVDEKIGGVPYDVLSVTGARPANGKTTWAEALIAAAIESGDEPLYFSAEDGEASFGARSIARASGVPTMDFLNRQNMTRERISAITDAVHRLRGREDVLVMAAGMLVEDVVRYVKSFRRKRSGKAGLSRTRGRLVVLDYLQKWKLNPELASRRHEAIGHITRTLSWLAQEEGIAVMALSQLSREVDKRADPSPLLSDFKDSGDIEQDAKMMLGLCYRHNYDKNRPADELELHILKNNNGQSNGVINLHWDLATHTLCEHPIDLPATRERAWRSAGPDRFDGMPPLGDEDIR